MDCRRLVAAERPAWLQAFQQTTCKTLFIRGLEFEREKHFFVAVDRRPSACGCPRCTAIAVASLVESLTAPTLAVAREQFKIHEAGAATAKPGLFQKIFSTVKELLL